MLDFLTLLRENPYPGRGILGKPETSFTISSWAAAPTAATGSS